MSEPAKPKISFTSKGSHGSHWAVVYGKEYSHDLILKQIEQIQVRELGFKCKTRSMGDRVVCFGKESEILNLQSLFFVGKQKSELITYFPEIVSNQKRKVIVEEVLEWEHADGHEAQIRIGDKEIGFGVSYFATDYAGHKLQYQEGGELGVELSGMAYTISKAEIPATGLEKLEFSEDFVAFLPFSEEGGEIDDYQFIGEINSVQKVAFQNTSGYLLNVSLVRGQGQDFCLDIFVNSGCIDLEESDIKAGARISGVFWLQGRLSKDEGVDQEVKYVLTESFATDPGKYELDQEKYFFLQKLMVAQKGLKYRLLSFFIKPPNQIKLIQEHQQHGDSQPAVVLSVEPLLVAAYAEDFDAVLVLYFPPEVQNKYNLKAKDRLICTNLFSFGSHIAPDIISTNDCDYINFWPLVADFLTSNQKQLVYRKSKIPEELWERVYFLGVQHLIKLPFCIRLGLLKEAKIPRVFRSKDFRSNKWLRKFLDKLPDFEQSYEEMVAKGFK